MKMQSCSDCVQGLLEEQCGAWPAASCKTMRAKLGATHHGDGNEDQRLQVVQGTHVRDGTSNSKAKARSMQAKAVAKGAAADPGMAMHST
jgi:hypothetical protein